MKEIKTWIAVVLFVVCLGVAVGSAYSILKQLREYDIGSDFYESMAEEAESGGTETEAAQVSTEVTVSDQSDEEETDHLPDIDFTVLQAVNSDIIAWLYCPGTVINYPVVRGTDNSYYLTHLADKSENKNGCLFVDCRNAADFSDDNTIIHGHHMKNGTMFAGLVNYKEQSYFEEHPVIYLETAEHQYEIQLFAGCIVGADSDSYRIGFSDPETYEQWIGDLEKQSDFQSTVSVSAEDRIVTLSTCDYDYEDARYVVHGKLAVIR